MWRLLAAGLHRPPRPSWAEMDLGSEMHTPRAQFRGTGGSEESQEHKNVLRADSTLLHSPLPTAPILLEEAAPLSLTPLL